MERGIAVQDLYLLPRPDAPDMGLVHAALLNELHGFFRHRKGLPRQSRFDAHQHVFQRGVGVNHDGRGIGRRLNLREQLEIRGRAGSAFKAAVLDASRPVPSMVVERNVLVRIAQTWGENPPFPFPEKRATTPEAPTTSESTTPRKAPTVKRRRKRKQPVEKVAHMKIQIETVIVHARDTWPDPTKRPPLREMADTLAGMRLEGVAYSKETLRQILRGTYKPMKRLQIAGLSG